jgi:dipeptidyl aminopeptidase/acylaminoacyl peptidase
VKPDDVGRLVTVGSPRLSPDGTLVAYVVARADLAANRNRSAIWVAATDGTSPPWQLTSGEHADTDPVWLPDGRRLAFCTGRDDDGTTPGPPYALRVVPVTVGGETVTLASGDEAFTEQTVSPDGALLAFVCRVRDQRYAPERESARPPRRVDRLFARLDSVGWTVDRPAQLFAVPTDGSAPPRQLTDGPAGCEGPCWSPDGHRLAFASARHDNADLDVVNDLWTIAADDAGAEPVRLTETDAFFSLPSYSPDGTRLACYVVRGRIGYRHPQLAVRDVAGGTAPRGRRRQEGAERVLTSSLDRNCSPYPGARRPVWDGDDLLICVEDAGTVPIVRVRPDGSAERLGDGAGCVTGFDARAGALVCTWTSATEPTELYAIRDGVRRRLTHHQRAFVGDCPPQPAERFAVRTGDGTAIDAWLVRPAGFEAGRRYPALLSVHGGPHTQYADRFFDEVQLWAGAGFAVVYANPRGSSGHAEDFARAIISPRSAEDPGTGWGGVDYDDLMAVVDAALERFDFLDAERLGILGGSYGGFMTSWAIGHTDRFAAAASERACNNLLSLEWSSDAAGFFRFEVGVDPLDHPEELLRMSPISYVRDIRTPVLILHSENDLRCPVEQADCLWVALRTLRRDVELYRFPAESHELSRSGSPRHRVQRAELIVGFFRRHLGDGRGRGGPVDNDVRSSAASGRLGS